MKGFLNVMIALVFVVFSSACQPTTSTETAEASVAIPVKAKASNVPAKQVALKPAAKIKWYTMEEAIAANEKEPKKFFIDVYTDWCHWCKVMDKKTFTNAQVAEFLNTNYYPVKFNAEQKEAITVNGKTYEYVSGGRRGVNTLAYALLGGRLSYPSFVYLNEKMERIRISPGYKTPEQLLVELR